MVLFDLNYNSAHDFDFGSLFGERGWAGGGRFNSKAQSTAIRKLPVSQGVVPGTVLLQGSV